MMLAERSGSRPAPPEQNGHVGATDGHERLTLHGADVVRRLRAVIHRGNVLRIRITAAEGETLIEIPSLLGIRSGGRVEAIMAAVGALASVSGELTIEVERESAWPPYED